MSHVRQQIRDQVVTICTSLTTTGTNVFASRYDALRASNLPCLVIYTTEEEAEPDTLGANRRIRRELTLVVQGEVKQTANADDTLDTIAAEVEAAMAGNRTISGLAKDSRLTATEIDQDIDGDQVVGTVRLSYTVHYETTESDAETAA